MSEHDDAEVSVDPVLLADAAANGPQGACLLFTAPWCPPGSLVAAGIASTGDTGLEAVEVDVDQYPYLADRWLVVSVPTLLVARGGRERGRLLGAFSPAEARTLMRRLEAAEAVDVDVVPRKRGRR